MFDLIVMPFIVIWSMWGLYDQARYEKDLELGLIDA